MPFVEKHSPGIRSDQLWVRLKHRGEPRESPCVTSCAHAAAQSRFSPRPSRPPGRSPGDAAGTHQAAYRRTEWYTQAPKSILFSPLFSHYKHYTVQIAGVLPVKLQHFYRSNCRCEQPPISPNAYLTARVNIPGRDPATQNSPPGMLSLADKYAPKLTTRNAAR